MEEESEEFKQFNRDFPYTPHEEINWVRKHPAFATPVLDQQYCACCWAIACALAISFLIYLELYVGHTGVRWEDFTVSPQQLVDRVILYYLEYHRSVRYDLRCCYESYNDLAYRFCRDHGLPHESEFEFRGRRQPTRFAIGDNEYPRCKIKDGEHLGDWIDLRQQRVIYEALAQQPVVAMMNITQSFKDFNGEGVFQQSPDEEIEGRHSIVVVAVNTRQNYFIIRNSWSKFWGKGGYAMVNCDLLYGFSRPLKPVWSVNSASATSHARGGAPSSLI